MPSRALRCQLGLSLFVCTALIPTRAAQAQASSAEVETALQHARAGELNGRDIVVIANASAVEAVPALKKQYRETNDLDTKVSIASALVKLRDPDNSYWNLLNDQAAVVLDSRIPDSNFSMSQGKMMVRSPELQAWATAHHFTLETAFQYARLIYPGRIISLAVTGDSRALPILRRALGSQDFLVVAFAAKGLALLSDRDSIFPIIAAAHKAPAGADAVIAQALIYFDDPGAQQAADAILPHGQAALEREARARGGGVFGYD